MTPPETVEQFFASATRQATQDAASAQESLMRYLDDVMAVNRSYVTAWAGTQEAALHAAFDFQNAMIDASRTMVDATVRVNRTVLDQWGKALRQGQAPTTKLVEATTHLFESSFLSRRG